MKYILTLLLIIAGVNMASAQSDNPKHTMKIIKLLGNWELTSVRYLHPEDFNNDGVVSAEGMDEMGECAQFQRIRFDTNELAYYTYGKKESSCHDNLKFTWKMEEKEVLVNGKEEKRLFLILVDKEFGDDMEMLWVSMKKKELKVMAEVSAGDSSTQAQLTFQKRKPTF